MKLKLFFSTLMGLLFAGAQAQDRTTVSATSSEISDNLDLRAVASIFGDSRNLEDFENRLNDPKNQISNLDLNGDNQVDYLRVVESVQGNAHIIVVQSVLGRDLFQDVATLEVEKDSNNRVQVQVVGDVYMYGANYIYEPVYVTTPVIYSYFWVPNYRPYCSSWYWGYYPSYYYAWHPFPIFRYRSHINVYINFGNHYNYVSYRRCQVAYNNYYGRRANDYERQYPNRSFASRNSGYTNRYELDRTRNIRTVGSSRDQVAYTGTRNNTTGTRDNTSPRNNAGNVRTNGSPRTETASDSPRTVGTPRNVRTNQANPRTAPADDTPRAGMPRNNRSESPRTNSTPRSNPSREYSGQREQRSTSAMPRSAAPRSSEPRSNGSGNSSRGGGQSGRSDRR